MSNIQSLIDLLQNDNPNKRYDACEELRVSPQPLPQEAIDALHTATNDSNPDVADAAQRALALQAEMKNAGTATTTDGVIQITTREFSKLTYRQKFALTEYGYLLSPEDAEQVGILMKNFVGKIGILDFCQSHGTKANKIVNWQLIGILIGLIPSLFLFVLGSPGWVFVLVGFPGILSGIIGAAIGNAIGKNIGVVVITAVVGAFLGSCLAEVLLVHY